MDGGMREFDTDRSSEMRVVWTCVRGAWFRDTGFVVLCTIRVSEKQCVGIKERQAGDRGRSRRSWFTRRREDGARDDDEGGGREGGRDEATRGDWAVERGEIDGGGG